ETQALLKSLRAQAIAGGRGSIVIETLVLEALALAHAGELAQAHAHLDKAIAQAAPEGFIGLFADFGPPLADLLAQRAKRIAQNDPIWSYIESLLNAFSAQNKATKMQEDRETLSSAANHVPQAPGLPVSLPLAEPLTERELEVLRLFAAGMTSPEIAEHFVVS